MEQLAGLLRWHRGSPARYEVGPLTIAVLADESHGPALSLGPRQALLVHGADPKPLVELQAGIERFAALEWDGGPVRASRDALGEVPLFFRIAGGAAWFASEIHPLVAVAPATADLEALGADAAFVAYGMRTGWRDVLRVPPGSTATIDAAMELSLSAHWRPDRLLATRRCSYPEAVAEFRELFDTAVARRRTRSDGVLLSGGLDSSAVAVAAQDRTSPPQLVTVTFPEFPDTDETEYARAVADAVGVPLTVLHGSTDPWDAEAEAGIFGTPSNLAPTGVFETAARHFTSEGVDRILDGHDGDGALGIYTDIYGLVVAHLQLPYLVALARRYGWRNVLGPAVRETLPPRLREIGRAARAEPEQRLASLLSPYFRGATRRRMEASLRWRPLRRSWRHFQLLPLTPPITVVFEQMETEAARLGVDVVHPFADRELLNFLVSLPFRVKVDAERTKPLLRDGLADVLPEIVRTRSDKVWFNPVLERRVDPGRCLEWIRDSRVELPDVDYQALFGAAERDLNALPTFGWIQLARAHLFAGSRD